MKRRKFVFMPEDGPDVLLFASIQRRMESKIGALLAEDVANVWSSPQEALQELLMVLYSVDLAMTEAGRKFPDSEDVTTMLKQWAIASPKALVYLNGLSRTPSRINLAEMSQWFAFFTMRRQTLELNNITVAPVHVSPVG